MDFEKVLKGIRPDEKGMYKIVSDFLSKINDSITKKKIKATAMAGGSIAKGTFLKGDHDVDIFLKFDKKYENEQLSDLTEKCLSLWKYERIHGSRDYFNIHLNGLKYEIIPVFDISNSAEAENITDFSPLHASWVLKQLKDNPELTDDIRLTKAFCKAAEVYGAESHIRGFSGHMVDILTIYYGGFLKLMKAASMWKEKQVVDYYDIYKGKTIQMLNKSKTEGPIEPSRNASASLSNEKFDMFIKKAQELLKNPSEEFFVKKKFSIADIKKKHAKDKLIVLNITPHIGKSDISGSKIVKILEYFRKQLPMHHFKLTDSNWNWPEADNAIMWFAVDKKDLPKSEEWMGPPLASKKNVGQFKKKYKKTFVKNSRLYATIVRKYTKPEELIKDLIKEDYVKEKVKKISSKII
jgi:tRNA nucleotidyltransferase (CCA-adding enzyme)